MNDKACWLRKTHSHKLRRTVWPIARSGNDAMNEHANAELNSMMRSCESLLSVSERYPRNPEGREQIIAEHGCLKYSGRVGRSAGAKSYDEEMVRLAVIAHVRHRETNYDSLLAKGWSRGEARSQVRDRVEAVLIDWRD